MVTAYIGLGSNLGEQPEKNLYLAREALAAQGLDPVAVSRVYRTEPQGYADQPWFANQVAALSCPQDMTADALLDILLNTEKGLGRVRSADPALRYGPRVIDLDLLLFGNQEVRTPRLHVPHPRMTERAFVLIPLLELSPTAALPGGALLADFLNRLVYTLDGLNIHQAAS